MENNRNEFTNTGMELVKGCACAVLGIPLGRSTIATKVIEGVKGRITIGPVTQPNPELNGIQAALDAVVAADLPILTFTIDRCEAEEKYSDAMYDRFEVPSHVTKLNVIYVKGLLIHATPHVCLKSTGNSSGLQSVTITKHKHRASKKELEVYFEIQFNRIVDVIENRMEQDGNDCCRQFPPSEEINPLNEAQVRLPAGLNVRIENHRQQQSLLDEDSNRHCGGGEQQVITPWEVEAADEIDYTKLVRSFGSELITEDIISRVERVTNRKAHRYLRRGLFFSHRDLRQLLDLYENGIPFYLYTGRGPSNSALHLGHLIPFQFTQYLQEAFNSPLVIQMTDDEKFLFKRELTLDAVQTMTQENTKDIIACGFDPERTFIFSDLHYIQHMYTIILQISKLVTFNQCRGIFGFSESTSIGCVGFPAIQAAPSFPSAFPCILSKGSKDMPCLIPCAIDQDAYFRMTRDVAPRMGMRKPALIHSKFIPGLQGLKGKMSSSDESSSIYVTDNPKQIKKKMGRAYSGGQDTKELQSRFGANIDVIILHHQNNTDAANTNPLVVPYTSNADDMPLVDVAYQYLTFFLDDDEELKKIGELYASGSMLSGEVKARAIEILTGVVTHHQERRAAVTDAELQLFTSVRPLLC